MISRALLDSKVRRLEESLGPRDALLHFKDGSTRAILVRDSLGLFCSAMDLMWWQMHGRFETPPCDPPKIAEKRRALIALISKAEEIEGDDKLFRLILGACRDTVFFTDCKSEDEVTERYVARQQKFKAAQFVGGNDEEH